MWVRSFDDIRGVLQDDRDIELLSVEGKDASDENMSIGFESGEKQEDVIVCVVRD